MNYPRPTIRLVDLGLPSGTLWGEKNLGSRTQEGQGLYFSWGNTDGHELGEYSFTGTYNAVTETWTPTYGETTGANLFENIAAESQYNAAFTMLGTGYTIPTAEQFQELIDNTTIEVIQIEGVNVFKLTGANGNYIILPITGFIQGTTLTQTTRMFYWSADVAEEGHAKNMTSQGSTIRISTETPRTYGFQIRPVATAQQ